MREWHVHEKFEVTKVLKAHLKTRNIYINYYYIVYDHLYYK